ncbi:MAG TPA: hypothetical protein VJC20_01445 [Candidatus Paceibacterota bacterium]
MYRKYLVVGMIIAGFGWILGIESIVSFGIGVVMAPLVVEFVSTFILSQL